MAFATRATVAQGVSYIRYIKPSVRPRWDLDVCSCEECEKGSPMASPKVPKTLAYGGCKVCSAPAKHPSARQRSEGSGSCEKRVECGRSEASVRDQIVCCTTCLCVWRMRGSTCHTNAGRRKRPCGKPSWDVTSKQRRLLETPGCGLRWPCSCAYIGRSYFCLQLGMTTGYAAPLPKRLKWEQDNG